MVKHFLHIKASPASASLIIPFVTHDDLEFYIALPMPPPDIIEQSPEQVWAQTFENALKTIEVIAENPHAAEQCGILPAGSYAAAVHLREHRKVS